MKRCLAPATFALLATLGVVLPADRAAAHGGAADHDTSSNYRTRVRAIEPAIEGVTVRVIDAGTRLELTNRSDVAVTVHGYDGEPYLRIGPDGVFENRRSAATYLNASRDGTGVIPDIVDPEAPPDWRPVSSGGTARWHDHRAHWMSSVPPPPVLAARSAEHVIFDPWVVPLRSGSVTAELRGDLTWVPPPDSARWWSISAAAFMVGALALRRVGTAWIHVSALGVLAAVDLVATAGVVASSTESTFNRASQFLYVALVAAAAVQVARRARRHLRGPHLAAGLAATLALGMSGASRLDGFANSQVATSLSGTLDRSLTVGVLAIGAALLVDFVLGLLPGSDPNATAANRIDTELTPEQVP